jgi:hypothetical protein
MICYFLVGCWAHRSRVQTKGMPSYGREMAFGGTSLRTFAQKVNHEVKPI